MTASMHMAMYCNLLYRPSLLFFGPFQSLCRTLISTFSILHMYHMNSDLSQLAPLTPAIHLEEAPGKRVTCH